MQKKKKKREFLNCIMKQLAHNHKRNLFLQFNLTKKFFHPDTKIT